MGGGIFPPASVVESWPKPNYVDPVVRNYGLVILCAVLGTISVMAVGARLYARAVIQRKMGIDDWLIVAAMVPTLGQTVAMCLASKVYYFDHHVWDVPANLFFSERKLAWALDLLYVFSSGLIKLSILFFYLRLASGTLPSAFQYSVWATIYFVIGYMIAFTIAFCFACRPFSAFWLEISPLWRSTHDYACINEGALVVAVATIAVLQDFVISILPVAFLWRLQIPMRRKIGIACIFGVGLFLCITGVVRAVYLHELFFSTYDVTWVFHDVSAWTITEVLIATVCASAPALPLVFRHVFPNQRQDSAEAAAKYPLPSTRKSSRMWRSISSASRGQDQGSVSLIEVKGNKDINLQPA